jgi:hypothetical protein
VPGGGGLPARGFPGVQPDVVVIATGGDERCFLAHTRLKLEPEDATVKIERAVEVGDLEVDVADDDAGINRGRGLRIHV